MLRSLFEVNANFRRVDGIGMSPGLPVDLAKSVFEASRGISRTSLPSFPDTCQSNESKKCRLSLQSQFMGSECNSIKLFLYKYINFQFFCYTATLVVVKENVS